MSECFDWLSLELSQGDDLPYQPMRAQYIQYNMHELNHDIVAACITANHHTSAAFRPCTLTTTKPMKLEDHNFAVKGATTGHAPAALVAGRCKGTMRHWTFTMTSPLKVANRIGGR